MNSSTKETGKTRSGLRPVFTVVNVILSCALAASIFLLGALYSDGGATSNSLTSANWPLAAGFAMGLAALIGFLNAILLRLDRIDDRFDRIDDRFDRIDGRFDRVDDKIESNRKEAPTEVKNLHIRLEKKIDDNHNQFRNEMKEEHNRFRTEMKGEHKQLRTEINEKHNQLLTLIQGLQTTMQSHEEPVEKLEKHA